MKFLIYFFISVFIFSSVLTAQEENKPPIDPLHIYDKTNDPFQNDPGKKRKPRQKLEQLEKIKLIEVLQMNEETTLRFFARRSEHKNKIDAFHDKQKEIISKINEAIESNDKKDSYYKKLNDEFLDVEKKISDEKSNFISSLSDILSDEQISKLIAFQDKWMSDVRNLLMQQRFRKHD